MDLFWKQVFSYMCYKNYLMSNDTLNVFETMLHLKSKKHLQTQAGEFESSNLNISNF